MQSLRITLADLADQTAALPVFVQMAVECKSSSALQFEAVIGERPPYWSRRTWTYENAKFVAEQVIGEDLWQSLVSGGPLVLDGVRTTVQAVGQNVSGERHPSRARFQTPRLPWPVTDFHVTPSDAGSSWLSKPSGFFVAGEAPSFPNYSTAWRAFTTGNYSMLGAQDSGRFGVIRIADTAAWLHRVTIHSTHLDVHVRGTETAGTIIEVNSASLRESKPVGKTGRIRFGLPAGLPDDAWLFLKSDLSLLDYRVLGHKLASVNELRESGVRIVLPDDPDTEIQAVLAAGEGVDVEYKRELPRDNIESKRKVLKTVAAFANSGGGDVVFGVDPDEVTIVGLAPGEVGVPARDRLGHLVHAIVVPTPEFEVKHFAIDGKELVVLRVARGQSGPYGLRFGQAPPEFYVRRGSSTYPASQTDIRSVALSQPEALVSQRAASISGSP